jgi:hypothetical protein
MDRAYIGDEPLRVFFLDFYLTFRFFRVLQKGCPFFVNGATLLQMSLEVTVYSNLC